MRSTWVLVLGSLVALGIACGETLQSSDGSEVEIRRARRASTSVGFEAPEPVAELNVRQVQEPGWISPDGCRLHFHSGPRGGNQDLYVAEKPTK